MQQQRQVQADQAGGTGVDYKEIIQSVKIQFQQHLQVFGIISGGNQVPYRFRHKNEGLGTLAGQPFVNFQLQRLAVVFIHAEHEFVA